MTKFLVALFIGESGLGFSFSVPQLSAMSFGSYLETHYAVACERQRSIFRDPQMVSMLKDGPQNSALVKSWMRDYGLFQGISGPQRDAVTDCFLNFAFSHSRRRSITDEVVKELYADLFMCLYQKVPRSWMSATSKLLWCLYPENIVIYDAFVLRTLVVLQCIDPDIVGFDRIGVAPSIKSEADVPLATDHYLLYQSIIRKLQSVHSKMLLDLRERNKETYPYDIRIIDKLLWMIGDSKRFY